MTRSIMILTMVLATVAGLSSASAAESGAYKVMVRADAWLAQVEDSIQVGPDTEVDYDDLNLDDGELAFSIQAGLRLPILMNIHAGFMSFETDKDGSTLTLNDLYGELGYGFNALGYAGVEAGLAVHSLGSEVDTSGSVDFDDDNILPAIALRAWVSPIESFDVQARLHWGELLDNTVLDAEVHLSWFVTSMLGIKGGYRYIAYEIDGGDDLDVSLGGPFLGASAQF